MVRQTIDAGFAMRGDINPSERRNEIDGSARGLKEEMPKIIVVEEAMHVGSHDAS